MTPDISSDVIIVGAGIAGASAAYFLSHRCSVTVIERESAAGYHSSGRSAAIFTVGISNITMRRMAQASRSFFASPPRGFAPHSLISPRGSLTAAWCGQADELSPLRHALVDAGANFVEVDAQEAVRLSPALRSEGLIGGLYEPDVMDIDADLLLQSFIRGAKENGAQFHYNMDLKHVGREGGIWAGRMRITYISGDGERCSENSFGRGSSLRAA